MKFLQSDGKFFFWVKLYGFYLKLCSRVILVRIMLGKHKVALLVPKLVGKLGVVEGDLGLWHNS